MTTSDRLQEIKASEVRHGSLRWVDDDVAWLIAEVERLRKALAWLTRPPLPEIHNYPPGAVPLPVHYQDQSSAVLAERLYRAIEHGGEDHRAWLRAKLESELGVTE